MYIVIYDNAYNIWAIIIRWRFNLLWSYRVLHSFLGRGFDWTRDRFFLYYIVWIYFFMYDANSGLMLINFNAR